MEIDDGFVLMTFRERVCVCVGVCRCAQVLMSRHFQWVLLLGLTLFLKSHSIMDGEEWIKKESSKVSWPLWSLLHHLVLNCKLSWPSYLAHTELSKEITLKYVLFCTLQLAVRIMGASSSFWVIYCYVYVWNLRQKKTEGEREEEEEEDRGREGGKRERWKRTRSISLNHPNVIHSIRVFWNKGVIF